MTSLVIDMNDKVTDGTSSEYNSFIFNLILNFCTRLIKFHFRPYDRRAKIWPIQFSSLNCKSAILSELKIDIYSFDECLYLFDGHFPSLSILIINVKRIGYASRIGEKTVNII